MNTSGKLLNRVIFFLSILGVLIALYVTQSFVRKTGIVCLNTGCEQVRKNPASYIFGIPVPVFGFIGYSFIAILAFLRTTTNYELRTKLLLTWMLGISTFGVLFVSWFTYTELYIIQAVCTWCVVSAINMVFIFILTLYTYSQSRSKNQSN